MAKYKDSGLLTEEEIAEKEKTYIPKKEMLSNIKEKLN